MWGTAEGGRWSIQKRSRAEARLLFLDTGRRIPRDQGNQGAQQHARKGSQHPPASIFLVLLLGNEERAARAGDQDHCHSQDPLEPADTQGGEEEHQQKARQLAQDYPGEEAFKLAEAVFLSAVVLCHRDSSVAFEYLPL